MRFIYGCRAIVLIFQLVNPNKLSYTSLYMFSNFIAQIDFIYK